jgi:nucleotide-binding universal stress UspA family protein
MLFELGTDGPNEILVGVDGTTTSLRAAAYAAGLARRQGAHVTAVFVAPLATAWAAPGAAALVTAQRETLDETAQELRELLLTGFSDLGIGISFIAAHGDPLTELRRIADEVRADAIVVGASAQAGHRLIGSMAVRLVRAGRWPVTVVP